MYHILSKHDKITIKILQVIQITICRMFLSFLIILMVKKGFEDTS